MLTTYHTNLNSAAYRLDARRPAQSLLDRALVEWEIEFRNGRYTKAREAWQVVERLRKEGR